MICLSQVKIKLKEYILPIRTAKFHSWVHEVKLKCEQPLPSAVDCVCVPSSVHGKAITLCSLYQRLLRGIWSMEMGSLCDLCPYRNRHMRTCFLSLPLHHTVQGHRRQPCTPGSGAQWTSEIDTLTLELSTPRTVSNVYCLSQAVIIGITAPYDTWQPDT